MTRSRPTGAEAVPIRAFAQQHARTLLRRLAYQLNQTVRLADANSVHDLRVSIRRFTQCLRVFDAFFPRGEAKKIRQKLKPIMHAASTVRDHDITLNLMKDAGIPTESKWAEPLKRQREQAEKELMDVIRGSGRNDYSRKWRLKLEL